MALIEAGAGLFLALRPGHARRRTPGDALPFVSDSGLRISGLCLTGLGPMCLAGFLRRDLSHPFAIMLACNAFVAGALAGFGILGGTAGPLPWPAVILHVGLVGLQTLVVRSG